ncbi:MAG: hypothetical protein GC151_07715 [Betaproteobacteria bacterium]|nr:hypothetical protein [Betaproteobacteria bacterium]
MSFDADSLYRLLPQVYRTRDSDGALRALVRILAEQAQVLQDDVAQLYDDQFIETCAEWVVPYIGDLVGARGVDARPGARTSRRNEVADTLRLRRRKGTAAMLEQLAHDVTDWDAAAVEFFRLLATTQYMNHLRPDRGAVASLRDATTLESLGTPFDTFAHTADVRRIAARRGRYNIPNVGLFLWTLPAQSVTRAQAFRVDDFRYTFDPLGRPVPLVTRPVTEPAVTHLAGPANVPLPITRRRLHRDLESLYGLDHAGEPASVLLHANGTDVAPAVDSNGHPVGSVRDLVRVCDLSDVTDSGGTVTGWAHSPSVVIAIDPELGRIAFPGDAPAPASVAVSCMRAFGREMGGGEYTRLAGFDLSLAPVTQVSPGDSLQTAVDGLSATGGVVELTDSAYYVTGPLNVRVPAGKTIALRARDRRRPVLVLAGNLVVTGGTSSAFTMDGIFVAGGTVQAPRVDATGGDNELASLVIRHCTLVPGPTPAIATVPARPAAPRIDADVPSLRATVTDAITGPIRFAGECTLALDGSIVDATAPELAAVTALDGLAAGGTLESRNSTVIGRVHVKEIALASNTIFSARGDATWPAPVRCVQLAQGCVRFSYVPPGSVVPRPYRCQPAAASDAGRVQPDFTSSRFGDAAYGQVSRRTAREIREGADDGAEMGAFHDLYTPQRLASLGARLDEFLRFGLEAGVMREN